MDGRVLLSNLNLLAIAPGGVAQLRELILTLAVQGKLVPQDPGDEPASVLLQKIRVEKDRLIAEGKVKQDKPLAAISKEEKAFALPQGWEWARLASIVRVLNGRAYAKQELLDAGTPVLRVGNLFTSKHWYYSDLNLEPEKYCQEGDLLYSWSASFGPFIWSGKKSIYHYHIWKLEPFNKNAFDTSYFHTYLLEKTAEIKAAGHGVSMVHMTKEKMEKIVVPFPPLAEQSRIVTRVEELMHLCDALEAKGQLEAAQHAQLVSTLLGTLTDSDTPEALADNWQRVATHFDLLLDRPEAVDALEQTILQLAVRGLLVSHEPNDEPASALLARVATHLAKRSPKAQKQDIQKARGVSPYEVPYGWTWAQLGALVENMGSGWSPACDEGSRTDPTKWAVLRTTAVQLMEYRWQEHKVISLKLSPRPDIEVKNGDILITRAGPMNRVGISCWVKNTPSRLMLSDKIVRFHPIEDEMLSEFIVLALNAGWTKDQLEAAKTGMAASQVNISQSDIRCLWIPVCSRAEQSRIVARVESLRRLCADLRQRLTASQTVQARLAEALVQQAA